MTQSRSRQQLFVACRRIIILAKSRTIKSFLQRDFAANKWQFVNLTEKATEGDFFLQPNGSLFLLKCPQKVHLYPDKKQIQIQINKVISLQSALRGSSQRAVINELKWSGFASRKFLTCSWFFSSLINSLMFLFQGELRCSWKLPCWFCCLSVSELFAHLLT